MSPRSIQLLAGFVAAALALPASINSNDVIPGRYIVALKSADEVDIDLHARWVADVHSQNLARRGGESNGIDETFSFPGFQGYSGSFDDETLELIKANNSVVLVEPELIFRVSSPMTQQSPPWPLSAISNKNPPSSSSAYHYDLTAGQGTFVYVLDSGIRIDHDEFEGRAVFGRDTSGGYPTDKKHGTHVGAIINGKTFGVAKKATVVDVQVLGSETGSTSGVISGVSWAVNDIVSKGRVGKAVINMSLGGSNSDATNNAVQAAIDSSIAVVVSAGNENSDSAKSSPANQPNAITVAASNKNYRRWAYSNWGTVVDLFAPGEEITSANPDSKTATYTTSGTSQAAPHVAGLVAYLLGLEGPRSPREMLTRLQELAINGRVSDVKGVPNLLVYNGSGQ
jgi:oryzin